jgi:hypothetical protein
MRDMMHKSPASCRFQAAVTQSSAGALPMSTSPFGDYRNGSGLSEPFDDKMQQIRELLFGEFKRDSDARLALIEARVRELEQGMHRKLDAIQASLDALSGNVSLDRKRTLDQLAQSISELGDKVRRMGAE